MKLNQRQNQAVQANGHCVVVACPGSGKTRVLIERSARLKMETPGANIIVVTFTRQAAGELRQRLTEKLPDLSNIRVSTFHSIALQQLTTQSSLGIAAPAERLGILRTAAATILDDCSFNNFQESVDAFSSGNINALDDPDYQTAYDTYLELLGKHSVVDFGQAILKSVNEMSTGNLSPLPCDYLLVDEVQDIDPTQLQWVMAHVKAGAQLTVVGDDDQSIYAFRHAMGYRGMQRIVTELSARQITLSTNYRSHSEVLGLSVKLINHNLKRVDKELYSAQGPGGQTRVHALETDEIEAQAIVAEVQRTSTSWAVIARSNRKLDLIEAAMRASNVEYVRPGSTSFWESEEPAMYLTLLEADKGLNPVAITSLSTRADTFTTAIPNKLAPLIQQLQSASSTGDVAAHIQHVANWMRENDNGIAKTRKNGVLRMVDACEKSLLKMAGPLSSRLERARRPLPTKAAAVTLLTMHGCKGREFPAVWVAGCQEGLIPNKKSLDTEEERRLLYVAMTRAEKVLHLSFAWNQVIQSGTDSELKSTRPSAPSRFLTIDLGIPVKALQEQPPSPLAEKAAD